MRKYTEEQLFGALSAVESGISIRNASLQWGIPMSTLRRRSATSSRLARTSPPCQSNRPTGPSSEGSSDEMSSKPEARPSRAKYTEEQIAEALSAIRSGTSLRSACKQWGIPQSTLHGRYHGSTTRRAAKSHVQRLSVEQETHLANWVVAQDALGLPVTHEEIRSMATRVLLARGDATPLGVKWVLHFLARNPGCRTKGSKSVETLPTSPNGPFLPLHPARFALIEESPACLPPTGEGLQ
ncbi:hypothetical protein VTK73DRAFT_8503 [Phialemonium thermophilum]|uniref:HTH CENPB-type domain-containing protein n=1 Tax=Phialemonium thermophilum TaxID=223376 RepID=A0ABR3XPR5_9PEZI